MNDKPGKQPIAVLPQDQLAQELSGKNSEIFAALERNAPKLSAAEIRKIAEQISNDLIENELRTLPPKKKAVWKQRAKNLAYDIGVGLATSGIWAALVYAQSVITWLEGREKSEEQIRNDRRMVTIREKLAEGLSEDTLDTLNFVTAALESRIARMDQLVKRLLDTEAFQNFLAEVEREDKRVGTVRGENFEPFTASEFLSALITDMRDSVQDQIVPPID